MNTKSTTGSGPWEPDADVADSASRPAASPVDVAALLDESRVRRGHIVTVAILFSVLLIDGYNLHITAQILPAIAADIGVSAARPTSAYAVQPVGQALGGGVDRCALLAYPSEQQRRLRYL